MIWDFTGIIPWDGINLGYPMGWDIPVADKIRILLRALLTRIMTRIIMLRALSIRIMMSKALLTRMMTRIDAELLAKNNGGMRGAEEQ